MPVEVVGLRELQQSLAKADREILLGFQHELREIAEPIARDAERFSLGKIRRMPLSPKWAQMRIGVTRNLVYVVPREKGTRGRGPRGRRRPNLADLMMTRAMEPALNAHEGETVGKFERLLDDVATTFNRS